jgi:SPX domain protein involved in polyphosphate accumulation
MQRLENKYLIDSELNKNKFLKFIFKNKSYEMHKKRRINSIYFDYPDFRLFDYSEEGLSSRHKIRLRYYGKKYDLNELNIEIKESHAYSKKKYVSNFSDTITPTSKNISDAKIMILNKNIRPTIKVSYDRRYFFSDKLGRLTLDENIIYEKAEWDIFLKKFNFKYKIREPRSVCEHKIENNKPTEEIFEIPNSRFSKYCEGIKLIYKI